MPQESDQNVIWPQEMQDDHIGVGVGVSDDDFTKFLDLDNDFAQFAAVSQHPSGLDTPMGRLGFGNPDPNINFAAQDQVDLSMGSGNNGVAYQHAMQPNHAYPHYQQQFQQMQMQPHYHVPPTPVSAEMHAAKYTQHMGNNGQILFDHQQVILLLPSHASGLFPRRSRLPLSSPQHRHRWTAALSCPTILLPTTSSVP